MIHCVMHELFLNKMLQIAHNSSTDGEVTSKIRVTSVFLGHGVYSVYQTWETGTASVCAVIIRHTAAQTLSIQRRSDSTSSILNNVLNTSGYLLSICVKQTNTTTHWLKPMTHPPETDDINRLCNGRLYFLLHTELHTWLWRVHRRRLIKAAQTGQSALEPCCRPVCV